MFGKIYRIIEKISTIFGFISAVGAAWALIYPGKAIDALENYRNRFAATEMLIQRTDENVQTLVDNGPAGLAFGGIDQSMKCPRATLGEDEAVLWLTNHDKTAYEFTYTLFSDTGKALYQGDGFIDAHAEGDMMINPFPRNLTKTMCVSAQGEGGPREWAYEVKFWEQYMHCSSERFPENDRFKGTFMRLPSMPAHC